MQQPFLKATLAAMGFILAGSVGVRGDALYQNTSTYLGYGLDFPNGQQIGEQIWLAPSLPAEYLTNFSFVYSSPNNVAWGVTADVRFYENNGILTNGYSTPGTLFYDSGSVPFVNPLNFTTGATNSLTANFWLTDLQSPLTGGTALDPSFILPTNFTFTITFSGLTEGETVGLPVFDPPSVGTNYADYWYDLSGSWQLLTNDSGAQIAFGAEFNGSPTPTPEPTVLALGAFGAAMLTVMARRRQRRG